MWSAPPPRRRYRRGEADVHAALPSGSAHRGRHPGADRSASPRGRPHAARPRDGAPSTMQPGASTSAAGSRAAARCSTIRSRTTRSSTRNRSRPRGRKPSRPATSERTVPPAASSGIAPEARSGARRRALRCRRLPVPTPSVNGSHHSSNVGCSTLTESAVSATSRSPTDGTAARARPDARRAPTRPRRSGRGPGRVPQQAQRPLAATVIPDARGDCAARSCHPRHLPHALGRIGHEVHDELREGSVERVIRERQLLRRAETHVDARFRRARGLDERLRRIDGGDGRLRRHARRARSSARPGRSRRRSPAVPLRSRPGRRAGPRAAPNSGP